jgi:hypothetical protein
MGFEARPIQKPNALYSMADVDAATSRVRRRRQRIKIVIAWSPRVMTSNLIQKQ